jgi:hypothetical protein
MRLPAAFRIVQILDVVPAKFKGNPKNSCENKLIAVQLAMVNRIELFIEYGSRISYQNT